MSEIQHPVSSTASLLKALAFALVMAALLFVTAVLPAEYGIDPTGLGTRLGLTNMLAAAPAPETIIRPGDGSLTAREDSIDIPVPARDGLEYKFFLSQYASLKYEWSSNVPLYFDLHGEPEDRTSGYFESYAEGKVASLKGTITTPFAGSHGWYFRNDTDEAAIVTLKTQGSYSVIGIK